MTVADSDGRPLLAHSRDGYLPYPQRCLREKDHIYIINFEPDRWPMGDPRGLDDLSAEAPEFAQLEWNTMVAYPDLDASPTKAWMIYHRKLPRYRCRLGCNLLKDGSDVGRESDNSEPQISYRCRQARIWMWSPCSS